MSNEHKKYLCTNFSFPFSQQEVPKNLNEIIEPIKQENQIKEPEQGQEQLLKQSSPESEQKQPRKNMNMFGFDETDEDISMSNASESAPTSDERVNCLLFSER